MSGRRKRADGRAGPSENAKPQTATDMDAELQRLQAELQVATAGLKAQGAATRQLQAAAAAERLRHAQDAANARAVLQSQQRENERLQAAARDLGRMFEESEREATALRGELQAALDAAAQQAQREEREGQQGLHGQPGGQLQRLLLQSKHQEEQLAARGAELGAALSRLQRTDEALEAERSRTAALQVRVQSHSQLRFVRDSPWLVQVQRERLVGALPQSVLPGSALAATGSHLVLESVPLATSIAHQQQAAVHVLDLTTGRWTAAGEGSWDACQPAADEAPVMHVSGRAVCGMDGRLLGFGGRCRGKLLGAQLFHPNLRQWMALPPPADASAPQPAPRHGAALAYCPRAHAAFLFGGQDASDSCLGDLWRLDCRSMAWSRLDRAAAGRQPPDQCKSPCAQDSPAPAHGAALAVAADGGRLWLLGGSLQSGRSTRALHWFDLGLLYWARVEVEQASCFEPRAHHAMACLGRFVVVAGGVTYSASGQATHRRDCSLFDTGSNTWEVLDDAAFELAAPSGVQQSAAVVSLGPGQPCKPASADSSRGGGCRGQSGAFFGAGTCAFLGSRLLVLKPSPELLWELWSVELSLPEEVDRMWLTRRSMVAVVKELTLSQESVGAASARLAWQPPTANRDKLVSFKLMMTNSDGRAREAYEGARTGCSVAGLLPGSQYVFCVKALYDDASFLWSQPLAVVTAPAARAAAVI